MKVTKPQRPYAAFTLVEMVGVLGVIAVLAGILIPKIFASLNEARINNAVTSYNTIQSAATTYFGKYGKFGGVEGETYATGTSVTNWDTAVLMVERLIDKPFGPRLSDSARVEVNDCLSSGTDIHGGNSAYNLDNNTSYNKNDAFGAKVVECVLENITREDAWELSRRIDGPTMSAAGRDDASDLVGRVKYNITGTSGMVRIYVAHK